MATQKIPSAEEIYQEEAFVILQEGTYDFQLKRILEELKNLNKDNGTVSVSFKAIPDEKILDELISQGYTVKFDTFYDSTKTEKYLTKIRITNPKFTSKCNLKYNTLFITLNCVYVDTVDLAQRTESESRDHAKNNKIINNK